MYIFLASFTQVRHKGLELGIIHISELSIKDWHNEKKT